MVGELPGSRIFLIPLDVVAWCDHTCHSPQLLYNYAKTNMPSLAEPLRNANRLRLVREVVLVHGREWRFH